MDWSTTIERIHGYRKCVSWWLAMAAALSSFSSALACRRREIRWTSGHPLLPLRWQCLFGLVDILSITASCSQNHSHAPDTQISCSVYIFSERFIDVLQSQQILCREMQSICYARVSQSRGGGPCLCLLFPNQPHLRRSSP